MRELFALTTGDPRFDPEQPKYHRGRWRKVMDLIDDGRDVLSIGEPAKCGHPKHPLMLPYESPIIPAAIARGSE